MAISVDILAKSGQLHPSVITAVNVVRAGTKLDDLLGKDLAATILHEACHHIDPKIIDIRKQVRKLPDWVSLNRVKGYLSKSKKTYQAYNDYGCRILTMLNSRQPPRNAESWTRAIIGASMQMLQPDLKVVSEDIRDGTVQKKDEL